MNAYPIVTLCFRDRRAAASLRYRNRAKISDLMYEQKPYPARGGSRGRVQGVRNPPPPEMTCGFLIQLVFCKKKKLCGLLVLKGRVNPFLKKILDPPLPVCRQQKLPCIA